MSTLLSTKSRHSMARGAALIGSVALASALMVAPAAAKPTAQQQVDAFIACLQLHGAAWRAQCGTPTLPYSFNTPYHSGVGSVNRCKNGR